MATIAADIDRPFLPLVRRLEASGFRAWPAHSVTYDGSWQRRVTPGHATRRPNSIVPLDLGDRANIAARLEAAVAHYKANGVAPILRETPLCPPDVLRHLSTLGWTSTAECSVMTCDLTSLDIHDQMDLVPLRDIDRFVEACVAIEGGKRGDGTALREILAAIRADVGMFLMSDVGAGPKAVTLCVHDGDLAGIQQVAVATSLRRAGLGRSIVIAALKWAQLRQAQLAWLQVDRANTSAISLYRKIGFHEVYRYRYWEPARG